MELSCIDKFPKNSSLFPSQKTMKNDLNFKSPQLGQILIFLENFKYFSKSPSIIFQMSPIIDFFDKVKGL